MSKVPVVSVAVMRESDAYTIRNLIPSKELMYRAGEGIFRAAEWRAPVGIVCGKGNNAGDGFVVASLLHDAGIECEVILLSDSFSEDGLYYFRRCEEAGIPARPYSEEMNFTRYGSVLDCIFGTGFSGGAVREPYAGAIRKINASNAFVVSADINSGLNGDTGLGELYVKSDLTVSVGTFKTGHFAGMADTAMKQKVNVDIGIQIIGEIRYLDI